MVGAAIILGFAALGGLGIAAMRFSGVPRPPTWLALGHGAIAATGVGILIYTAMSTGIPELGKVALGVLIAAALGGATLFLGFHMRERPLPKLLVVGHGAIALAGYILLLVTISR